VDTRKGISAVLPAPKPIVRGVSHETEFSRQFVWVLIYKSISADMSGIILVTSEVRSAPTVPVID